MKFNLKRPKLFWWLTGTVVLVLLFFFFGIIRVNIPYYAPRWSYFSETSNLVRYRDGRYKIYNHEIDEFSTEKLNWIAMAHEGDTMTVIALKGKRGYLNLVSGRIQIKPVYRHAWQFSEGLGAVDYKGKIGFIDSKGQTRIPFKFNSPHPFKNRADFLFKKGYCTMVDTSGKFGLIDKKGNWVIQPNFDYINNPILGLRIIKLNKKYGLLDEKLSFLLPIEYDNIEILQVGLKVAKDDGQQLISKDTKTVLKPFVYDDLTHIQFNTGRLEKDGAYIFQNTGFSAYCIYSKWGLMDPDGKVLTKAIYSNIYGISQKVFRCQIESYSITIDNMGNEVKVKQ